MKKFMANSQLSIMHYELWIVLWRSGYRRRAFRSIFAPLRSAKDAASIPNALEAANSKSRASNNNSYLDA